MSCYSGINLASVANQHQLLTCRKFAIQQTDLTIDRSTIILFPDHPVKFYYYRSFPFYFPFEKFVLLERIVFHQN